MKALKRTVAMLAGGVLAAAGVESVARVETTLPRETVMAMVVEEAAAQGVPADLALAVAEAESGFATLAISSKGARGVMQMMPRTARDLYGLKPYQLFDARTNIRAGVDYLGALIERYGREDLALSHYNGGSGVRRADGGYAVLPATRRYVDRVLSRRRHYANMGTGGRHALPPDDAPTSGWRAAASRELAALDRERRRIVDALRVLVAENTRRAARLPGAVASKANAPARVPAVHLLSSAGRRIGAGVRN
ncbi:MAG: lytic transglycosylase domain-containing protein [Gammaproteobacteria bacterium]|nr:lytic transglycosylase domain-containing protein [Gammaproteobacteria bacterium]